MNFSLSTGSGLIFEPIEAEGFEQVLKVTHAKANLTAIISIHNTSLSEIALGGTRIQPYPSFEQALEDVLRLSRGMTYKSAIAEVGFGGGKSVIIANPKTHKSQDLLLAFAEAVEHLGGKYVCAEDVGSTPEDMRIIATKTPYVVGTLNENSSGNPSPFTAWGTFRGIQATLKKCFGTDSVEGKKIAIQGLGSVGCILADFLFWAGADLILSDIDEEKTRTLARKYRAKAVTPKEILEVECDLLAPCALGGVLNRHTIPLLRCQAIAGAANNQLMSDADAELLRKRSILYAPDFVINAGGLINVTSELAPEGYQSRSVRQKVDHIYDTLLAIYEIAEKNGTSSHKASISLADYKIRYKVGRRTMPPQFPALNKKS